jgi:acetyl esterase/lipase
MGDSAGAGFALALAQKMKKDGISQSDQIILISPWLDVITSNSEIKAIEKQDPMLGVKGLQLAGKAWAENIDTKII